MKKPTEQQQQEAQGAASEPVKKKNWREPKLIFIKPKLTKHGQLEDVTGQFFGAFSPGQSAN